MKPSIRQWLYTISAVASALIPLLVTYRVLDAGAGSAWAGLFAALGAIGSGGAATAAVVLSRQRKEGTLDFTGSAAEQAIGAIRATVEQAGSAASDLDKVIKAATEVAQSLPKAITDVVEEVTTHTNMRG